MARRTVFRPVETPPFYDEVEVEFEWEKGRPSLTNARRNVEKLAEAAQGQSNIRVIEVSRATITGGRMKAEYDKLSAFKLRILITKSPKKELPLEVVYQAAKVWEGCEDKLIDLAILDLMGVRGGRVAKKASNQQRASGARLRKFCIKIGEYYRDFPIEPRDAFYNWLYILSLRQEHNRELSDAILKEVEETKLNGIGFSDIFFKKKDKLGVRYNCQARAVAIFVGLYSAHREEMKKIFPSDKSLYDYLREGFSEKSFEDFCKYVYGYSCAEISSVAARSRRTVNYGTNDSLSKSSRAKPQKPCKRSPSEGQEKLF